MAAGDVTRMIADMARAAACARYDAAVELCAAHDQLVQTSRYLSGDKMAMHAATGRVRAAEAVLTMTTFKAAAYALMPPANSSSSTSPSSPDPTAPPRVSSEQLAARKFVEDMVSRW